MLPLNFKLEDKHVLLIGGGNVGESRVKKLRAAHALVTVVSPELTPALQSRAQNGDIEWVQRKFENQDLEVRRWFFVLTAITPDRDLSIFIASQCREKGIMINAADIPEYCDFYFGAQIDMEPLHVMVSTEGAGPRLARRIMCILRSVIEKLNVAPVLRNVRDLRQLLKDRLPMKDPLSTRTRMLLMTSVCDKKTFGQLASLTREKMEVIVDTMLLAASSCPHQPIPPFRNASDDGNSTEYVGLPPWQISDKSDEQAPSERPQIPVLETVECDKSIENQHPSIPNFPFGENRPNDTV